MKYLRFENLMENIEKKINIWKWLSVLGAIFFVTIIFLISFYWIFEKKYANKIYPNIFIGDIAVGGLIQEEAQKKLNQKIDQINQNGIIFSYDYYQATLFPIVSSVESDLSYQLFDIETERAIKEAYEFGRQGNWRLNLNDQIDAFFDSKHFNIFNSFNEEEIKKFLVENFSRFETPAEDARLSILPRPKKTSPYNFEITEEKYGQILNYELALNKLQKNLRTLDNSPISLEANIEQPQIYKKDCLNIETQAMKLINEAKLTLQYDQEKWEIGKDRLAEWLQLKTKDGSGGEAKKIYIGPDEEITKKYLEENIAVKINKEPIEAKFNIVDGKVKEFQVGQDGLELDIAKTIPDIESAILSATSTEIKLATNIIKNETNAENVNDLGIKEIIGTGRSKFTGSPKNRRHNIATGANALNGLLIKPDEEFSLVKALGSIDKAGGYLPELVIKENKTVPEYGGGLCQIGTTLFRTALASGLEITMRRNHSYRVSYYEPAGTDATIYDPWPDFKFKNDTKNNILIQTYIKGDDIWFDFWGSSDGRVASTTYPTIYNIVKPGPTKMIETDTLKPGEKKCTESAHNGADAYFDYTITYPDREKHEERFKSHYVPWRAVCLIGKDPNKESGAASSTPSKTE